MKQMFSRAVITLVALAALTALILPAMASAAVTPSKDEQRVMDLINTQRTKHDLPELVMNTDLVRSSGGHSAQMADKKYFSHDSYNGESFSDRIVRYGYTKTGYSSWHVGENIYWGTGLYSTPVAVVQAWMGSSAHRAVILDAKAKQFGVGKTFTATFKGHKNVSLYTLDTGARTK